MFANVSIRSLALLTFVALCASACFKEPTPAEAHRAKANELFKAQDYAGCATELEQSLTLDAAQDSKAWEKVAYCFLKAGKADKAGDWMVKYAAQKTKPEEKLETLRNAAGMYMQGALYDKAEPVFLEVMKLAPTDEGSLGWLAEISSQRGGARRNEGFVLVDQLEIAVQRYDQLLAMNPSQGNLANKRVALARMLVGLNQQKEKLDKADKAGAEALAKKTEIAKAQFDETSKKLSEMLKAAKAAKEAAKAAGAAAPAPAK